MFFFQVADYLTFCVPSEYHPFALELSEVSLFEEYVRSRIAALDIRIVGGGSCKSGMTLLRKVRKVKMVEEQKVENLNRKLSIERKISNEPKSESVRKISFDQKVELIQKTSNDRKSSLVRTPSIDQKSLTLPKSPIVRTSSIDQKSPSVRKSPIARTSSHDPKSPSVRKSPIVRKGSVSSNSFHSLELHSCSSDDSDEQEVVTPPKLKVSLKTKSESVASP